MRVTMVKLEPCRKCAAAEELLRRRGLWDRIDEVVVGAEDEPDGEARRLARRHGVETAPFFVVEEGGSETIYESVLVLMSEAFRKSR